LLFQYAIGEGLGVPDLNTQRNDAYESFDGRQKMVSSSAQYRTGTELYWCQATAIQFHADSTVCALDYECLVGGFRSEVLLRSTMNIAYAANSLNDVPEEGMTDDHHGLA
jgi:hypothetical protein